MSLNFYALEQEIEVRMKAGHVPGFAIAIVQDQKVLYAHGFGYTAVDQGECGAPVTPQTLFRIGSTTKPLTGTAIMRLVEAGMLDLDTPVKRYIPWLKFREAGVEDVITLRMLLSHTSGLFNEDDLPGRRDPAGLEAYVRETISQYPMVAPPGKGFYYSAIGICLAGYIAEVVCKKNYTQLMQELVFDPLGMKRTTFDPIVAMTYPLAQSHVLNVDGNLSVHHRYIDNVGQYPETSANSTVLDLTNFCMMQMNHGRFGGEQILSPASVDEMQRVQTDMFTLDGARYGLTLYFHQHQGVRLVGHGGLMTTHFTLLEMALDSGIAIIALGNRYCAAFGSGEFMKGIWDQMLGLPAENPKPHAVKPDKSRWGKYVGSYMGNWKGVATILASDDGLVLDWNGEEIPLYALKGDHYYGQKPDSEQLVSVGFIDEESGPAQYILLDTGLSKRVETGITPEPDPGAWAGYAGQYQDLLDILTLRVEGDRLVISSREWGGKSNLVPLGAARFASQMGMVEFQVDRDGVSRSLKLADLSTFTRI